MSSVVYNNNEELNDILTIVNGLQQNNISTLRHWTYSNYTRKATDSGYPNQLTLKTNSDFLKTNRNNSDLKILITFTKYTGDTVSNNSLIGGIFGSNLGTSAETSSDGVEPIQIRMRKSANEHKLDTCKTSFTDADSDIRYIGISNTGNLFIDVQSNYCEWPGGAVDIFAWTTVSETSTD